MDNFSRYVLLATKLLVSTVSAMFLGLPDTVKLLFVLMVLDYASGLLCGAKQNALSSSRGWVGMKKKAMMLILVCAGQLIGSSLSVGFGVGSALALYFSFNETLSIIENAALLGIPVPSWFRSRLEKVIASENKEKLNGEESGRKHDTI